MFRIGIDLGGTKIEGIVLDAQGKELFRKRVETQQEKGYAHILDRIKGLHDELAAGIQGAPHTFGIGTPGAISPRTGLSEKFQHGLHERPAVEGGPRTDSRPEN